MKVGLLLRNQRPNNLNVDHLHVLFICANLKLIIQFFRSAIVKRMVLLRNYKMIFLKIVILIKESLRNVEIREEL